MKQPTEAELALIPDTITVALKLRDAFDKGEGVTLTSGEVRALVDAIKGRA